MHSSGQVQPAAPQPSLPLRVVCPVWGHALLSGDYSTQGDPATPQVSVIWRSLQPCWGEVAGHVVGNASGVCIFNARLPYSGPGVAGRRLTSPAGHAGIREKGT